MWKNKHVVVALLVAPVLALLAYFAVDAMVSPPPEAARAGRDYPLRVLGSCRYASGECEVQNGDVRIRLRRMDGTHWVIDADVDLDGVLLSEADGPTPVRFSRVDNDPRRWRARAQQPAARNGELRLVVAAAGSRYYAELPTTFLDDAR